ncbi:MAG TPA: DUF502 domain-containing protein, partial [Chryseolinea sp.]|nr:DUF502 domain-containing protein [Chryseolinea sp.]
IHFLRVTLTGGILFLLPMVLLIVILKKAHDTLLIISAPLARKLPELIFGLDGSNLLAIALLIIVCFVSGLLFRSSFVRKGVGGLEESVLLYLPGYAMLKAITRDTIGDTTEHNMTTVLVQDGDTWNIGFLVEEDETFCTVFIPEAPRHDSGEVKIVPAASVKKTGITTSKGARSLTRYGKGAINWMS